MTHLFDFDHHNPTAIHFGSVIDAGKFLAGAMVQDGYAEACSARYIGWLLPSLSGTKSTGART